MRRGVLHGLFFLSGVSALVYELVWQRLLNLVFGVSTLSVSTVLAAFMGGLALGGLLFGRLADRTRRPLHLYALLETAIGVAGLLLPLAFAALTPLYERLAVALQPGQWGGACLRFAVAFPVVAGLAALIGGTLPVMGRLALKPADAPGTFSLLYAVNTLGAAVGAALTGFVLLRYVGMRPTLEIAAGVNFLVALGAIGLGHRRQLGGPFPKSGSGLVEGCHALVRQSMLSSTKAWHPSLKPQGANRAVRPMRLALVCAALTGATSMGFEVAWARVLGILTSNSAYGFALLLTILLLGLVLGSLVQWLWSRRPGDGWRRLLLCQWLLAAITLGSLPFFHHAPEWLERLCDGRSVPAVFLGELGLTALALLLPAVLMGLSLPLLVAGVTGDGGRFGHWLGRVYAVNTLGCVVGAFTAGFVLIPWLGIQATFNLLVAGCLLTGLLAWLAVPRSSILHPLSSIFYLRFTVPALVLGATAVGLNFLPAGPYLKSPVREPRRLLYYREGNNGTVSVVEEANGTRHLMVDGQPVAGTAATSVIDQKMLAHLPLLLHPNPQRALTVGFGSGGTSYSMALHGVSVDCVEIEAAVPAAAEHFRSENHDVRKDRHFRLVLDDARSWLRVAPVRYDAIVTDCTNVQYRGNGDLYTTDYFRLMRDRLTPDGIAAAWVPANGISGDDLKTLLRSFREVFPHTSVWFMNVLPTDFLIVVGTPDVPRIDLTSWEERMRRPGVSEDLAVVGLGDPCRLAYTFLVGEEGLAAYLGDGPLNTDDRPVLSYSTYGATFRATVAANLVELLACREDVGRYVTRPPSSEALLRHLMASNEAILGHLEHWMGDDRAALVHYLKGGQLLPKDTALRELVRAAYGRGQ
jgi:spermidine synthase